MTNIYFIRHCEPKRSGEYNDKTYPLSEKGLADCALVTDFLQDKHINIMLSSPFKRAIDTISDFAIKHGLEIELIDDFRERKIADTWIDDFYTFAKKQWEDFSYKLPNGENLAEVQARNINALNNVLIKYKNKNIVIGTHGQALATIINYYNNDYGFDDFMAMANIMPWVAKMTFDNNILIDLQKIDLFKKVPMLTEFKECKVKIFELGELQAYKYTVVFARYNNKWIYCRNKNKDVFETAGGSINEHETAIQGAKRELYEETGVKIFTITPVFDYAVYTENGFANGQVFYAEVQEFGEIPKEFEMTEIKEFETIPEKMRFPNILPVLYEQMDKWCMVKM